MESDWVEHPSGIFVRPDGKIRLRDYTFKSYERYKEFFGNRNKRSGYMEVWWRTRNWYVHILVAETFLEKPEGDPIVHHKNGLPWDNRLSNLEWLLNQHHHAREHHGKLNEKQVKEILLRRKQGEYQHDVAKDYGISRQTVADLEHGKTWKHVPRP